MILQFVPVKPYSVPAGFRLVGVNFYYRGVAGQEATKTSPVDIMKVDDSNSGEHLEIPEGSQALRIFVVDDEPVIIRLVIRILEKAGHMAIAESDSVKAIEILNEKYADIDVLMSDMNMPNISGDTLIAEALKLKPDMGTVLMTGATLTLPATLQKFSKIQLLAKPLDEESVLKTLNKVRPQVS